MFAKQTLLSASLVIWLFGATPALAEESTPEAPETGEDHQTGRFLIGAGFSSVEGFIATAQVAQDDLFGTGTQLSLSTRISALRQSFDLRVGHDHLFGSDWGIATDVYSDSRVMPGFIRDAAGFKTDLSHPLGKHARAFIGYRLEQVTATDTLATSPRALDTYLPPLGGGLNSAVRAGLEWSNVDRLQTRGARIGGTVEVSDPMLGSSYDFSRVHAYAEGHIPLGGLVLHLSGGVESILGAAPRSERIYLGMNDVRGYDQFAIGPVNGLGQPVGGDLELRGRAELELPLSRRYGISLVGFYDAAAITADRRGQAGASVGFGILWRSPIGNLRFDWAFPIDGDGKPHFVFGL
ncbi:MAG TPA: BamA/TamA family outer membrane protein [Kofleriaceae bacterium]|nr:BamA/TamA family outer membrane protein [Kofleriaceae bacterium]